jgi:hypothetical protein
MIVKSLSELQEADERRRQIRQTLIRRSVGHENTMSAPWLISAGASPAPRPGGRGGCPGQRGPGPAAQRALNLGGRLGALGKCAA